MAALVRQCGVDFELTACATSSLSAEARAASAVSCAACAANSASWPRALAAKRFAGTNSGKMQASSDGRNMLKIMPFGRAGLPNPESPWVS